MNKPNGKAPVLPSKQVKYTENNNGKLVKKSGCGCGKKKKK
ncbi:hypothetical protein ACQKP0_11930 [Heyndrickxia sp. NPDC080065]